MRTIEYYLNHIEIDSVWTTNKVYPKGMLIIDWSGDIGCGRCEMFFDNSGKAHVYTEGMEEEDKSFVKALLIKIAEQSIIEE